MTDVSPAMLTIRVHKGSRVLFERQFSQASIAIGSNTRADVFLPDQIVDRTCAVIAREGDVYVITAQSPQLLQQQRPITSKVLAANDVFEIGPFVVTVLLPQRHAEILPAERTEFIGIEQARRSERTEIAVDMPPPEKTSIILPGEEPPGSHPRRIAPQQSGSGKAPLKHDKTQVIPKGLSLGDHAEKPNLKASLASVDLGDMEDVHARGDADFPAEELDSLMNHDPTLGSKAGVSPSFLEFKASGVNTSGNAPDYLFYSGDSFLPNVNPALLNERLKTPLPTCEPEEEPFVEPFSLLDVLKSAAKAHSDERHSIAQGNLIAVVSREDEVFDVLRIDEGVPFPLPNMPYLQLALPQDLRQSDYAIIKSVGEKRFCFFTASTEGRLYADGEQGQRFADLCTEKSFVFKAGNTAVYAKKLGERGRLELVIGAYTVLIHPDTFPLPELYVSAPKNPLLLMSLIGGILLSLLLLPFGSIMIPERGAEQVSRREAALAVSFVLDKHRSPAPVSAAPASAPASVPSPVLAAAPPVAIQTQVHVEEVPLPKPKAMPAQPAPSKKPRALPLSQATAPSQPKARAVAAPEKKEEQAEPVVSAAATNSAGGPVLLSPPEQEGDVVLPTRPQGQHATRADDVLLPERRTDRRGGRQEVSLGLEDDAEGGSDLTFKVIPPKKKKAGGSGFDGLLSELSEGSAEQAVVDPRGLEAAFNKYKPRLISCYTANTRDLDDKKIKSLLHILYDDTGKSTKFKVSKLSVKGRPGDKIDDCLRGIMKNMSFPRPPQGYKVDVKYSLILKL